jgi:integral membrane protein (TIGR01906 family)
MSDPDTTPEGDRLDIVDPSIDNNGVAVAGRQGETHMGFARSLATIIFIIALPVALVTTNVRLLLNAPLVYDYAFDRYNAEETTGMSREDLDATAASLREYFNNDEPTFYETVTLNGLPTPVLNARETQHMEDVKELVVWVNRLQVVSVMLCIMYGVIFFCWSREGNLRELAGQCLASLLIGGLVVGSIGAIAAVGFDAAFTRFHEIAFSNDLWQLNPRTDRLIQMFPEEFWRDATFMLGAMCLMEAALIAALAGVYLLSTKSERSHLTGSITVGSASSSQAA